jgi:hypothetical protein
VRAEVRFPRDVELVQARAGLRPICGSELEVTIPRSIWHDADGLGEVQLGLALYIQYRALGTGEALLDARERCVARRQHANAQLVRVSRNLWRRCRSPGGSKLSMLGAWLRLLAAVPALIVSFILAGAAISSAYLALTLGAHVLDPEVREGGSSAGPVLPPLSRSPRLTPSSKQL